MAMIKMVSGINDGNILNNVERIGIQIIANSTIPRIELIPDTKIGLPLTAIEPQILLIYSAFSLNVPIELIYHTHLMTDLLLYSPGIYIVVLTYYFLADYMVFGKTIVILMSSEFNSSSRCRPL